MLISTRAVGASRVLNRLGAARRPSVLGSSAVSRA
jgi:hypothetical protein